MSLLPSPPPRPQEATPDPARTLDQLATLLMGAITVAALYLAREVLVPIAIALILSFVLSPPIRLIRQLGVGKRTAVGIVVALGFLIACGIGLVMTRQITVLIADGPLYQATITRKMDKLKAFAAHNAMLAKMDKVLAEVSSSRDHSAPATSPTHKDEAVPPPPQTGQEALATNGSKGPVDVELVQRPPGVLTVLRQAAGSIASPIATAIFVAVFVIFMLLQREDLRNRFIRLMGSRDIQRTTLALTDAARRLSRYFLAQVTVNTCFGVFVGAVMLAIGVPGAVLWGFVTILMRFVPYIGSIASALPPIALAAAASSNWSMAAETAALYAVGEFVTGQLIEPLVYGHNTGLSPIAVVISATFWTWLWGPIGLVLATPLTVCLVVLGRHANRLAFLEVLFGDRAPLTDVETFYQRMLAGDPSEVLDHADRFLAKRSLLDYSDHIAMPALLLAQHDVRRGVLDADRQGRILAGMRDLAKELVQDIAERDAALLPEETNGERSGSGSASIVIEHQDDGTTERPDPEADMPRFGIDRTWKAPGAIVCVAGRTPLDEAAAHLMADLLEQHGIGARVAAPASSLSGATEGGDGSARRVGDGARLLLLSFLDAQESLAQARFAVRRLRRQAPGVPIVPAFWTAESNEATTVRLTDAVRCETGVSSLPAALRLCLERARDPAAPSEGAACPKHAA